jgi:hypothetical protein
LAVPVAQSTLLLTLAVAVAVVAIVVVVVVVVVAAAGVAVEVKAVVNGVVAALLPAAYALGYVGILRAACTLSAFNGIGHSGALAVAGTVTGAGAGAGTGAETVDAAGTRCCSPLA